MLSFTLRNLLARKVRLLLSAFAIVLGVGFVAGSFVFTDTMASSFDKIAYGTVASVNVRPVQESSDAMTSSMTMDARRIDASVVDDVRQVDGVRKAAGGVQGLGLFVITKENRLLSTTGAPTLAFNVDDTRNAADEEIIRWVSGRAPEREGEVAIDARAAKGAGYRVGDTIKLATLGDPPIVETKLTGIVEFSSGSLAGATLVLFDTKTAQAMFMDGADEFNTISIERDPSVSEEVLTKRVQEVLPEGLEAVSGTDLGNETKSVFDEVLGFLNTFLLVFAGISLVVGSFLIVNTFSMLVAQRSSELALLRAMGASRRQVQAAVLIEAAVVGFVGSILGLGFGFGLAALLKSALGYLGIDLSGTALVFLPRTVIVAVVVGVVVTLLAAYIPARRASKVPPVAAMRDDQALSEGTVHWRVISGVVFALLGFGLFGLALWTDLPKPGWMVGAGIISLLLAVIATSVVTAIPVLAGLGRGFRGIFGFVGLLAEQNSLRNPRRTAATASALTIGLALVTTMSIMGASLNASIDEGVDKQFTTDFIVTNPTRMPISSKLTDQIVELPSVAKAVPNQSIGFTIGDEPIYGSVTDPQAWSEIFKVNYVKGEAPVRAGTIAFNETKAKALSVSVGDTVELAFLTGTVPVQVAGIFEDSEALGQSLAPYSLLEDAGIKRADTVIAVNKKPNAGFKTTRAALERITKDNPTVVVQDKESFAEAQRAQVNTMLYLIYALLGLAIVIAILGIVNTLALSVIERTRELGLLRAVGLERGQLRRMVRLESVALAVLGAILGIATGTVSGVVLQRTFVDDGITALSIPVTQLVIFLAISALVGVMAAVLPAHRAAKLNILDAISVE
ncbi:MAG: FtsX-like permease family protein [Aeromicrobium sp.]|nr:MAG: FtsX-like permease family protein [Aeromicrobium sp.]